MSVTYTFDIQTDFPNQKVHIATLSEEIQTSSIITALDYITQHDTYCDIVFKAELSNIDHTTLIDIVHSHTGEEIITPETPKMPDGRPIIRADTRPLQTQTYFTMAADGTSIGDGIELVWDFSNDDNLYTGPEVPPGFKAKQLLLKFHCPVYLKDGTVYFFDAPWGQYLTMEICVPPGTYYPNPAGTIPASALGFPGNQMYSYASELVPYVRYVNKHRMFGSCPMGGELNAEGASVDPVPIGWYIRGLIITPESDTVSRGYGEIELYRCHTVLLPGQTVESLHG